MKEYRHGAHRVYEIHLHLVWVTKYRRPGMVRMHSECLTGDALGSLRCDCWMQLQAALKMIENVSLGVKDRFTKLESQTIYSLTAE